METIKISNNIESSVDTDYKHVRLYLDLESLELSVSQMQDDGTPMRVWDKKALLSCRMIKITQTRPGELDCEYLDRLGAAHVERWTHGGEPGNVVFVDGKQAFWPCGSPLESSVANMATLAKTWRNYKLGDSGVYKKPCPHCRRSINQTPSAPIEGGIEQAKIETLDDDGLSELTKHIDHCYACYHESQEDHCDQSDDGKSIVKALVDEIKTSKDRGEKMKPLTKHGGKRTGAGRKPVDELGGKAVQIFLPLSLLAVVDAEAERLAVSRSELVRNSLLAYLSE